MSRLVAVATADDVRIAYDLLSEWTGFALKGSAPRRIREFLARRAGSLGYRFVHDYLAPLLDADPAQDEPQKLINLLTNGLTAFWRDEPQLEALTLVLTELAQERDAAHPIHVWCGGCSSGEEAYTIAMIAAEHGLPVNVLGTDINTDLLAQAHTREFGEWSLRRLSDARRARFFRPIGDGQWRLSESVASRVTFKRHNLLDPAPRPSPVGLWDVITCRNVFIYFKDAARKRVLRHFARALDDDGYLLLGSSEQLDDEGAAFRASRHGSGFVYRCTSTPPGRTLSFPTPDRADTRVDIAPVGLDSLDEETVDFAEQDAVIRLLNTGVEHLEEGRREVAIACYEAAAGYDPFIPDAHCLMGVALASAGARLQAVEAFQKALFLDPLHWFAAFEAGRLHETAGDFGAAVRKYRQALEGLARRTELFDPQLTAEALRQVELNRSAVERACQVALSRLS